MRILSKYLGSSLVICSFVGFGLFQCGDAGKTLKLPNYDVTFGTWPLMEVTRTGSKSRGRPGGGRYIGGPPSHTRGYRLGPPPPPGKLLLLSPSENKVAIHQHLQDTLKKYAGTKAPGNGKLPIIVKASGPNPPPPPPGYILGPPGGPPQDNGWQPGPPPLGGAQPIRRPSRLMSMLRNAAFSGIFKNEFQDTYTSPEYSPGLPLSGTYMTINPDGSHVTTHVNDDFLPGPPVPAGQGVEAKPSVPPVIRIGENLPENYSIDYAQRQIVALKSPDTLEHSGNDSPGLSEYEVGLNLGTKYEQGYGAKPPPTHPLVITKFQKRGNIEPIKRLVQQDLPDNGLMVNTNIVFSSPNISAPLGGKNSVHFKQALEDKQRILKHRRKEKPLDAQVKLLGRLFTKLQRLKPPKIAVPEHELSDDGHAESAPSSGNGWGWGEDDDGGWKKESRTKVDSPIMAVQIQTFSAPEVSSSDPDILESMAEFGNHDVEFGETDEIVNLMDTVMKHGSSRVNLRDLGSNPQEINDNMLSWVRRHLAMSRNANQQAHSKGERIASNQFKQYQTFITPPFGNNGWGPGESMPVDPKVGRRSFALTMTAMTGNMNAGGDTPT